MYILGMDIFAPDSLPIDAVTGEEELTECLLCCGDILEGSGATVVFLGCCGFMSHWQCLVEWKGRSFSCPLCRQLEPAIVEVIEAASATRQKLKVIHGSLQRLTKNSRNERVGEAIRALPRYNFELSSRQLLTEEKEGRNVINLDYCRSLSAFRDQANELAFLARHQELILAKIWSRPANGSSPPCPLCRFALIEEDYFFNGETDQQFHISCLVHLMVRQKLLNDDEGTILDQWSPVYLQSLVNHLNYNLVDLVNLAEMYRTGETTPLTSETGKGLSALFR
jgi:hypothetical protein